MSEKDYTSTLLRMAGNIAGALVEPWRASQLDPRGPFPETNGEERQRIARASVALAREILKQVTEDSHE